MALLEFEVKGLDELARNVLTFPEKLQKKTMKAALRAGGMVIRNVARNKVPVKSGRLRSSIRVQVKYRNGRWVATIIAGRNKKPDDPYYALMVERGTKPHEIRPKGARSLLLAGLLRQQVNHPGADAKPFLGPALEDGAQAALEAMRESLAQAIGNFTYDGGL